MPRLRERRSDTIFTEPQVRALYVLYNRGYSVRQLADCYWDAWGFKTQEAAATSIYHAFRIEDLPIRDAQQAAQVRGRDKPRQEQLWQEERSLGAGYCQGRVTNYPRKGVPCRRRVRRDERYCAQHDPRQAAERQQRLAQARAARVAA